MANPSWVVAQCPKPSSALALLLSCMVWPDWEGGSKAEASPAWFLEPLPMGKPGMGPVILPVPDIQAPQSGTLFLSPQFLLLVFACHQQARGSLGAPSTLGAADSLPVFDRTCLLSCKWGVHDWRWGVSLF